MFVNFVMILQKTNLKRITVIHFLSFDLNITLIDNSYNLQ